MEGKSDGTGEQDQINSILKWILSGKLGSCEEALNMSMEKSIECQIIRNLWESELEIAQRAYERLIED